MKTEPEVPIPIPGSLSIWICIFLGHIWKYMPDIKTYSCQTHTNIWVACRRCGKREARYVKSN
jgi:hypothetical protein